MKHLFRITYLYLTIPFIIFCMGWLRLSVAIPVVAVIVWALWQLLKQTPPGQYSKITIHHLLLALLVTGIWLFLSGVGGYAFQNWDHHWRNAVFRDLVTNNWPVIYSSPERGPITMLVYYLGDWLPAALFGRVFGWSIANFMLFLWTWLGVLLTVLHLNLKLKTSLVRSALLLIFFSGLDVVGALLFAKEYPTLWPPITHLEIWSGGDLQYSSFTTQLFWVFNQAVPAWLCIVLILGDNVIARRVLSPTTQSSIHKEIASGIEQDRPRYDIKFFIWALSFFFAPLASIGLMPYLMVDFFTQADWRSFFKSIRVDLLFAAEIIFLLSYFFFSSNTAAQERGFHSLVLKDWLFFFLLDGGIFWLMLAPFKWRDPRWAVTGILLLVMPFIQLGNGRDFVMRASIAPLFYLMMMVGETIFKNTTARGLRFAFYVLLFLGALTPLYEINRSAVRTYEYYFVLDETQRAQPNVEPATHLEKGGAPELEHPNAILADDIYTLTFMQDKLSKNFIANVRQSLYYRYLSSR
ncbi:MAG TPA: hypothetical protein PLN43_03860 [Anaerolineales bacterium]|nr:hypothetical protein [Anaerolineales bacterium]